jgi:hypothetical protein
LEGGEQLIGTAVDLVSSRVSDGLSEQTPLLVESGRVALPEPLDELGRSLDIGEHQSDGPDRRLDHVDLPTTRYSSFGPLSIAALAEAHAMRMTAHS